MSVKLGSVTPVTFKLGSTQVSKLYVGGTQVWPTAAALTISGLSGSSGYRTVSGGTVGTTYLVTSAQRTYSGQGGTGPYTYAWTELSDSHDTAISNATSPVVSWNTALPLPPADTEVTGTSVWRLTVTDSVGATATLDVTISAALYHDSGA